MTPAEALTEAAKELRKRADRVALEMGEHAAALVEEDAVVVARLAERAPDREEVLNDVHAELFKRLVTYLEDHPLQSVKRALADWRQELRRG
jgi:hypothetical protein